MPIPRLLSEVFLQQQQFQHQAFIKVIVLQLLLQQQSIYGYHLHQQLGFLTHLFPLVFIFQQRQQLFSLIFQQRSFLPMVYHLESLNLQLRVQQQLGYYQGYLEHMPFSYLLLVPLMLQPLLELEVRLQLMPMPQLLLKLQHLQMFLFMLELLLLEQLPLPQQLEEVLALP